MYSYGPPHMAGQKQDDQLEHTFSSYVRIRDVALKTYQRQWTIGRSGERGSGISVLAARHNDDDFLERSDAFYINYKVPVSSFNFYIKISFVQMGFSTLSEYKMDKEEESARSMYLLNHSLTTGRMWHEFNFQVE